MSKVMRQKDKGETCLILSVAVLMSDECTAVVVVVVHIPQCCFVGVSLFIPRASHPSIAIFLVAHKQSHQPLFNLHRHHWQLYR